MVKHNVSRWLVLPLLSLGLSGLALPATAGEIGPATESRQSGVDVESEYLAGWMADLIGSGSLHRLKVPRLDCSSGETEGIAIGVGEEEFEGDPSVRASVFLICEDGEATYRTDAYANFRDKQGAAAPGDVLQMKVKFKDGGRARATVINLTKPRGSVTVRARVAEAPLLFGAFPLIPDAFRAPVPKFDKIRLVRAAVAGTPLSRATATRYQRVEDGDKKISTGGLVRRPHRGTFSLRFEDN